jgi:PAS domain-containing protein
MALQSQKRRRRRRSSARVVAQPVRVSRGRRRFKFHLTEVLASIGILVATLALVALVWIIGSSAIQTQRTAARAQINATLGNQSLVLADEIRREMLGVEQSLRIIKQAFQADPAHFDMPAWKEQMSALTDVTQDVFIADAQHIVQHDIHPQSVGLGVGARLGNEVGEVTTQGNGDETLLIGPTMQKLQSREHLSYLMVRLDRPGWIVGATYRTGALTRLYAGASLGLQGMTALVNTRLGRILAVVGPAAADPNYDIAGSPMYREMQSRPAGTWVGASAPDGVRRIHAFRAVPDRDLSVVVAVDEADAMQSAEAWAEGARSVGWAAVLVIVLAAALALRALWTFRGKQRLREALDRERAVVARTQLELSDARGRLERRTGQLQALLGIVDEGVLALDAELRAMEWNRRFPLLFGLPADLLQPGLPLDAILRVQAQGGAFGPLQDIEAEVAQRVAQLRTPTGTTPMRYTAAAGKALRVLTARSGDGGLVLMVREATAQEQVFVGAELGEPPPGQEAPLVAGSV